VSKTRGARRVWRGLAVAAAGLALTGCAGLHPGVAAQVGDEAISISKVDEVAKDFCEAVAPQIEQNAVTHGYLRGAVVGTLAMRSIAEQVAEERGVDPTSSDGYDRKLAEARQSVASLPEELRDSVVELSSTQDYVEAVQAAVGRQQLDGQGSRQDFIAAGSEEFDRWAADHGVEFDPAFNTVFKDGAVANQDQAVSYAVSEPARNGLEQQLDPAAVRQLPESQRCGGR
jgi:hypothetical protein